MSRNNCPSCGVDYRQHMGLTRTCEMLVAARKRIAELEEQLHQQGVVMPSTPAPAPKPEPVHQWHYMENGWKLNAKITGRFETVQELIERVLYMHYMGDRSIASIARNVEVSFGTVNKIIAAHPSARDEYGRHT